MGRKNKNMKQVEKVIETKMATLVINGPCSSFDSSIFSRILIKNVQANRVNFGINKTECDLADVGLHFVRCADFDKQYIKTLYSQRWHRIVLAASSLKKLDELLWALLIYKTYNIDCSLVFICLSNDSHDWLKLRSFGFEKICLFDEQVIDFTGLKDFSKPTKFIEEEMQRKTQVDEELKKWESLGLYQQKLQAKPVYEKPKISSPGMVQLIAHLGDQIFDRDFSGFKGLYSFMFPTAMDQFFKDFKNLQDFSTYYLSEFQMNNYQNDDGKRISFPCNNKIVICNSTNRLEDFKYREVVLKKCVFRQKNGDQFYFVKVIHSSFMNQQTRQEARFLLSCLNGIANNSFEVVILIAIYYAKSLLSKNDLVSSFYRRLLATMLENVDITFTFTDKMIENALKRESDFEKIDENLISSTRAWLISLISQRKNLPTKSLKTPFKLTKFEFIQLDETAASQPLIPSKKIDLDEYQPSNNAYFELNNSNWPTSENLDISECTNVRVVSSMPNIILYSNVNEFKEALVAGNRYLKWFKKYSKFYLVGGALISKLFGIKIKDYDMFSYYSQEETLRIIREFAQYLKDDRVNYTIKLSGKKFHFFQIEIRSILYETIVFEILSGIDLADVAENQSWLTMLPNQIRYSPARDAIEVNKFTLYALRTGCFPVDLNWLPSLPRMAKCFRDNGFTMLFPKAANQVEKLPKPTQDLFLVLKKLLSVLIWNWGAQNSKFRWFFLEDKKNLALKPGVLAGVDSFLELPGGNSSLRQDTESEEDEEIDDESNSYSDDASDSDTTESLDLGSSFAERQVGRFGRRTRNLSSTLKQVTIKDDKFFMDDVQLVSSKITSEEALKLIADSDEIIKILRLKYINVSFYTLDTYPLTKWLMSFRDGHLGGFNTV